jgi:hypothetical protein
MHPKIEKLTLDELAGGFFDIYVKRIRGGGKPQS